MTDEKCHANACAWATGLIEKPGPELILIRIRIPIRSGAFCAQLYAIPAPLPPPRQSMRAVVVVVVAAPARIRIMPAPSECLCFPKRHSNFLMAAPLPPAGLLAYQRGALIACCVWISSTLLAKSC